MHYLRKILHITLFVKNLLFSEKTERFVQYHYSISLDCLSHYRKLIFVNMVCFLTDKNESL